MASVHLYPPTGGGHKPLSLLQLQKQLRRVWDLMVGTLNSACLVQREGMVFGRSMVLNDLFRTVDLLCAEDKNRLAAHELEMVVFARKFAVFMRMMQGNRLRSLTPRDLQRINCGKVTQSTMIRRDGSSDSKEAENAANERPVEGKGALPVSQLAEGAEEQVMDETTSPSPIADDAIVEESTQGEKKEGEATGAKKRSQSDHPADQSGEPKKVTLTPLHYLTPPSSQPARAESMKKERDAPAREGGAAARADIMSLKGVKKVLVVDGKAYVERKPADGPAPRRKMINCLKCAQLVEENDVVMHYRIFHAAQRPPGHVPQRPPTVTLKQRKLKDLQEQQKKALATAPKLAPRLCPDLLCDFACETERERLTHQLSIHCDPFKAWKKVGRFSLQQGSVCPFCPFPVANIAALRDHLFRVHPTSMHMHEQIYACTSCDVRFGRLFHVYAHWHFMRCTGRMRIVPIHPPVKILPARPRGRPRKYPLPTTAANETKATKAAKGSKEAKGSYEIKEPKDVKGSEEVKNEAPTDVVVSSEPVA